MAFSTPLTEKEKQSIIEGYHMKIPTAKIAENLGRSVRTVQQVIKDYKDLKKRKLVGQNVKLAEVEQASSFRSFNDKEKQKTLERLREARSILHEHMLDADTRNIASIVKEYRAVCDDIERLEGTDDAADDADPIMSKLSIFAS